MLDDAEHWMALEGAPQDVLASGQAPSDPYKDVSSRPERSEVEKPAVAVASVAGTSSTAQAALPTMHYGTAQSYFDAVEPHLNSNSPTWNYDLLAKGWHAPPAAPNGDMGLPTWNDELYFEYRCSGAWLQDDLCIWIA